MTSGSLAQPWPHLRPRAQAQGNFRGFFDSFYQIRSASSRRSADTWMGHWAAVLEVIMGTPSRAQVQLMGP